MGIVSQANLYHNNINIIVLTNIYTTINNEQLTIDITLKSILMHSAARQLRALTNLGPTQEYNGTRNVTVKQMASVLMHYI